MDKRYRFTKFYIDNTGRKVGFDEYITCLCGCGESIPNRNRNGLIKYKDNHKKNSEETKRKMAKGKLAEKNPMWKGDNVGYSSLHQWVKRYFHKTELCQMCNITPPYDLANISGKYLRDLNDWQWLCRKCHMNSDGRMNNLIQYESLYSMRM